MTTSPSTPLRRVVTGSRRFAIAAAGITLVVVGVVLVVLPGPGVLVVALGLAVLATEFTWAARALQRTTSAASTATGAMNAGRLRRVAFAAGALALVVAGVAVAVGVDGFRSVGIGAVVAGVSALAMLAPITGRWLDRTVTRLAPPEPTGPEPDPDSSDRPVPSSPEGNAS